ncbi:ABC transporter permease [Rhizobium leguminosarum]|uniref:ABC transporter permease n=1 Tax=Rhizobium leguminosarum TaxID=384 RepID=UPI001C97FF68|nr:ABC transporter permease [Rhizobium leguminosarum]MBY5903870.1 ABC transporter permease [Rhizobium leguminosarum]MBY5911033.1 ABC transporter permease [Rhizobium leguminosarum]
MKPSANRSLISRFVRENATTMTLATIFMAVLAVFGLILGDRLLSVGTFQSIAFQTPELGILGLAMMLALLSGGLNLSIISTANLCALTIASVLQFTIPWGDAGSVLWLTWQVGAVAAGLAVAILIGLLNGFIIAYLGVSPILATLGTMIACKGLAIGLTRGNVLSGFPDPIVAIGNGTYLGVPLAFLLFAALCVFVSVVLRRSSFGQKVYLVGANEKAAQFSGIHVKRVLLLTYALSGALAGCGGLVMMARFNSANASYGESFLLISILAAVLGGIDPYGGTGKVSGLFAALLLLQLISSAFNLMNFSQFLTIAIWGALLIGVSALRSGTGIFDRLHLFEFWRAKSAVSENP